MRARMWEHCTIALATFEPLSNWHGYSSCAGIQVMHRFQRPKQSEDTTADPKSYHQIHISQVITAAYCDSIT